MYPLGDILLSNLNDTESSWPYLIYLQVVGKYLDLKINLREFDVSVKGMHACCKAVILIFRDNGERGGVNLATVAVDNLVAGQSRYITAKVQLPVCTRRGLAKELMKFNIQTSLVAPNMTDTDLVSVL